MKNVSFSSLLAMLFSLALSASASARTQDYVFTLNWYSGPLAGSTSTGSLSFDNALAIPNSEYLGPNTLTTFMANVGGRDYGLGDVETGFLVFGQAGELRLLGVGTDCSPRSCRSTPGNPGSFYLVYDSQSRLDTLEAVAGPPDVTQSIANGAFAAAPVPEPSALGLFMAGAVMFLVGRRKAARPFRPEGI